ncbi:MIP/aquaporin family protein [Diaminobutyricimonas sp. LJ205]|uniref:aquaporin n=1 Tax=Diaminobutyricimonas sp. LJ205 TaxID=2683590 RepID=UPI0012F525CD|nr:MIP/aquaporin family protein [Diaminobutyricimonas sp. LJ205]
MPKITLPRRLLAEFLGSALLAAVVIGSGIAASRLSEDAGLQLLQNALVTGAGLFALILIFAPASGAHFNPVVSLVDAGFGERAWRDAAAYIPVQIIGCIAGAMLANVMFDLDVISISANERLTGATAAAEVVATAGLVMVIFALTQTGRSSWVPTAVGAYITAAYYFTSSTSFANPAITIGRIFSDTFAGIDPGSAPGFIAAQLVGGALGFLVVRALYGTSARRAEPATMGETV